MRRCAAATLLASLLMLATASKARIWLREDFYERGLLYRRPLIRLHAASNRVTHRVQRNISPQAFPIGGNATPQMLYRHSGRFYRKIAASPIHRITPQAKTDTTLYGPSNYNEEKHHQNKFYQSDKNLYEAKEYGRTMSRTTMRVKFYNDIDATTPIPSSTTTSTAAPTTTIRQLQQQVMPANEESNLVKTTKPPLQPTSMPTPVPVPITRPPQAFTDQRFALQVPPQVSQFVPPPQKIPEPFNNFGAPPSQISQPSSPPIPQFSFQNQFSAPNFALPPPQPQPQPQLPQFPQTMQQNLQPQLPAIPHFLQASPIINTNIPPAPQPSNINPFTPPPTANQLPQAPLLSQQPPALLVPQETPQTPAQRPVNSSYEVLGCAFDFVTNSCKDLFNLNWCGQCHDFGNVFMHDCKCVRPIPENIPRPTASPRPQPKPFAPQSAFVRFVQHGRA